MIKIKAGGFYHQVNATVENDRIILDFPYNKALLDEIKENFEGRKYLGLDGGPKAWAIPITQRNLFRLQVLQGKYAPGSPYQRYDLLNTTNLTDTIVSYVKKRELTPYTHQIEMINQALITRHFIWAADMGLGKTLAAIIVMEMSNLTDWFWIGPRSALIAAQLDFEKWQAKVRPRFLTYEALRDLVEKWPKGQPAPQGIIFDEASKLKTPTSKRTVAAKHVADSIRREHENGIIGLLSGTPAPKSPADWWSLAEVCCPGYIREGHITAFRARLAILEKRETVPGAGAYDHLISWRDDSTKCHFCGQIREHANHTGSVVGNPTYQIHDFKESVNEVAKLHTRLRGLVIVKLKKDCLDLPEKRYEVIRCKPTNSILRAAQLITKTAKRSLDALMLLRELSDGFQYREVGTNEFVKCSTCKGKGDIPSYLEELTSDEIEKKVKYVYDSEGYKIGEEPIDLVDTDRLQCPMCRGTGQTERMERSIVEVECPKDQVLIDMLERHEEAGRLNIYAGFEGSIDRVTRICKNQKWAVIRADGRGWCGFDDNGNKLGYSGKELMQLYTSDSEQYPNIAFVGQPGAAGMGLTLTASPTTFFFSNDFNGESRMQAEDRGHRIGMDIVKGGLIVDCFHLPTDEKVFNNLKLKKDLQYLSMTGLQSCLV